ncbi:MAG: serine/threonine-protein kinase [Dokdonella sp.]
MSHTLRLSQLALEDLDLDLSDPAQRAFGEYELLECVGRGGMGVVYRARQCSLDRDVALKVLAAGPWAGADFIERLRTEARHAARLAHPHIISVFDVGQQEEFCYYTMRLITGESLRERLLREHTLSAAEAVRITLSIAGALAYAHEVGMLHLDIKPANILLDKQQEPHLGDFGLARTIEADTVQSAAEVSGTPHYMAPEQAYPRRYPLSASTDIFALGATLFEMLAGRPPLDGAKPCDVMLQLGSASMPRLSELVENADRELEAICSRCLACDPAQRYDSAESLANDLRRWERHRPVQAMRSSPLYLSRKFVRRNRVASALSALIIALILTAMVAMGWQIRQTAREADRNLQIKDQLIQLFLQPEDEQYGTGQKTVREFLDQGGVRLESLPLGSDVRSELAGVMVGIYNQLGQWQSAATLAERELGGAPITAATAAHADLRLVTGWAVANYGLGHIDGVLLPLARAIDSSTDTHSKLYLDALVTQNNVAIAAGDFASAVRGGELALRLMQNRAVSKADISNAHMELAAAYVGMRQPRKGREHSEIGLLEIGPEDSIARVHATTMAGLRRALFGEFESAQSVFDDGAAQWKRLSMSFPANFESLSYAVNAFDMGDLDRAETTIKHAVAQSRIAYPKSLESADWHWLPGEVALLRGHFLAAAEYFAEGAALASRGETRFAAQGIYLLALQSVALARANRLTDSQRILEVAEGQAAALPHADFATSMVLAAKALLLSSEKRHGEALVAFDQAIDELEAGRNLPAVLEDQLRENRDALRFLVWKAQLQIDAGLHKEAIMTASEADRLGLATLGPNHPFMRELGSVKAQLLPAN